MKDSIDKDCAPEAIDNERRRALSRLGLVATVAYVTPALLTLSQSAQASGGSGGTAATSDPEATGGGSTPLAWSVTGLGTMTVFSGGSTLTGPWA